MNEIVEKWRRIFTEKGLETDTLMTIHRSDVIELLEDIERGELLPEPDPDQTTINFSDETNS